ncbi:MAG TPA: thioredoxin family protein [Candidatus Sulfotelmatobacter sp.]|nr:thioredoxin family protein [Candidatus Sulfotelmatobacter sp.]
MSKRVQFAWTALVLAATFVVAQTAVPTFAPFEQWKKAVLSGDAAALREFYSIEPVAKVQINSVASEAEADINFWLSLKPRSMTVEVVRNEPRHGHVSFIFRCQVVSSDGNSTSLTDDQSWQQIGGRWRLISVERTDAPQLTQPANMKKDIYPANVDAHAEIKEGGERAAREHKRLLLVFGANWCFDCHVLDLAFQRPDLAPILAANYEVIHIDLGPEEEKNSDLVHAYQIPLNKGVPALAVAESDGKLVVSQKNGEFEDARGLTPEVLIEFLNKWKPEAR